MNGLDEKKTGFVSNCPNCKSRAHDRSKSTDGHCTTLHSDNGQSMLLPVNVGGLRFPLVGASESGGFGVVPITTARQLVENAQCSFVVP
jgi:hypothetical protein